jgi:hypothetical protein
MSKYTCTGPGCSMCEFEAKLKRIRWSNIFAILMTLGVWVWLFINFIDHSPEVFIIGGVASGLGLIKFMDRD